MTTQVLRINALGLTTGALFMPMMRMFQILDRIHLMHVLFLTLAVSSAIFGYLFVVGLGLGVRGVAIMQVISGSRELCYGWLAACTLRNPASLVASGWLFCFCFDCKCCGLCGGDGCYVRTERSVGAARGWRNGILSASSYLLFPGTSPIAGHCVRYFELRWQCARLKFPVAIER